MSISQKINDNKDKLGERMKKIRLEKGMTQRQAAEACKMAEANYRKYELGKVKNPKIDTIFKIALGLGTSPSVLVCGNNPVDIDVFDATLEATPKGILVKSFAGERYISSTEKEFYNWLINENTTLLENYYKLNYLGRMKADEQVEMLTKIDEYTKKDD